MQGAHVVNIGALLILVAAWPTVVSPAGAGTTPAGAPLPHATVAVADQAADSTSADLGPTSAPPWNPPAPLPAAQPWETVLRFPGRVVSLPLSALGWVARSSLTYAEDNSLVPKVMHFVLIQQRLGLYAMPASLGPRTGWGGALGYAPRQLGDRLSMEIDGSTEGYNSATIALREGPARLRWYWQWRPSDQFFGLGRNSLEGDRSYYAYREQLVRLSVGQAFRFEGDHPSQAEAEAWIGPREAIGRDGHGEEPPIATRFPSLASTLLDRHVEHLIYGARVSYDTRHGMPHWSGGWRTRVTAERFDRAVKALAIRDAGTPSVQFTRLTYEADAGASFGRDPRTLRLAVRAVDTRPANDGVFLLPDLAQLGGDDGLAGYEPGRFYDFDLVVARLSYIYPLAKHFEFDIHAEAGNVFGDLGDARIEGLRHSFGVALRPRLETAPLGALGIDWSKETLRFRFSIGGVE